MAGLDLPRCGLFIGVGLVHAAAVVAFTQLHAPARPTSSLILSETLFFPAPEQVEEPPPPVVNLQAVPLRISTSLPLLSIESTVSSDAPPSPNAPTAIVSEAPAASGGGPVFVETVQYVQAPKPRYPQLSRRLKEQGVVVLKVLVNERGEAQRIEVADSSGHERLDQAAVQAVATATFRPLLENGVPRAMLVLIPIEFGLHRART